VLLAGYVDSHQLREEAGVDWFRQGDFAGFDFDLFCVEEEVGALIRGFGLFCRAVEEAGCSGFGF